MKMKLQTCKKKMKKSLHQVIKTKASKSEVCKCCTGEGMKWASMCVYKHSEYVTAFYFLTFKL
jgi:hypothetical protein